MTTLNSSAFLGRNSDFIFVATLKIVRTEHGRQKVNFLKETHHNAASNQTIATVQGQLIVTTIQPQFSE